MVLNNSFGFWSGSCSVEHNFPTIQSASLVACTRQFYKLSFGCSVRCVVCLSLSKLTNQVLQVPNTQTTDRVW